MARTIADSTDPDVLTVGADIGAPGAGDRIVAAALHRFGRIDTVVNNAGIFVAKPFTEYTDADYDAVLGVNVRGSSNSPAPPCRPCSTVGVVTSSRSRQPLSSMPIPYSHRCWPH